MCHMSHVTCHVSRVMCRVSHITMESILQKINIYLYFLGEGQSGRASWWKVCHQWGYLACLINYLGKGITEVLPKQSLKRSQATNTEEEKINSTGLLAGSVHRL